MTTSAERAEPPKPMPHTANPADGDEPEDGAESADGTDESAVAEAAPVARGNALARQAASVRKQVGRARGGNGFFISSWFSEAPDTGGFAPAEALTASAPEDCEPLDATIAEAYIRDSAKREGVSTDLIREVIRKESGFYPCAVSPKGAMGMMQLTAATAASLGVDDPYDARQNIDGGVRLMKRLLDKYKGRPDLALAAYNAGEGVVDAHQGVPDYAETREYVTTIMKRVFEEAPKTGRNAPRAPAQIAPIPPVNVPAAAATASP
ncbi:MAG: lytic transglycosylase domain-containing protein [Bryobacterales bacterium]|nr:lytic transglycosylase domain-containing protein [Bryobacterales bacterium]